jgi:hypothetical protein
VTKDVITTAPVERLDNAAVFFREALFISDPNKLFYPQAANP